MPSGVAIYADAAQRLDALAPPRVPRVEVIDELVAAIARGVPPLHSGEWGLATLEACLAVLESSRTQRDVALRRQVAAWP